jgi:phage-related protein
VAKSGTLTVKILGDSSSFEKAMGKTAGGLGKFAKVGAAALLAVGAGAVVLGTKLIAAGEAAATSNARIDNIVKSMDLFGASAGEVTNRLVGVAEATARATGIDQNSIKATQAKLLTFRELAASADEVGGTFDRTTQAAIDLASAGFGTAETNAAQLGKALNDPIKGLTSLTKSGVTFTEAEKDRIKTLVESNRLGEAQEIVLAAIESQVGGTAEATANASDKMKVAFSQTSERVGQTLLPAFESLSGFVLETVVPAFERFYGWAAPQLEAAMGAVQSFISGTVIPALQRLSAWWDENGPAIVSRVREIADVIGEWVTGALAWLAEWWATNGPQIIDAMERIAVVVRDTLVDAFNALAEWWATNGPQITTTAQTMADGVGDAFDRLATAAEWVRDNWNQIRPVLLTIAGLIATVLIPHYIALGVQATISAIKNVAAWVVKSTAAMVHGAKIIASIVMVMLKTVAWVAVHVAQAAVFVAKWVWMGAQSLFHAAKVVAGWAMTGAAAIKNALIHVAQVGVIVAKWVFLGAQSLLAAGKVALAWLIAMGPIALVVAAVIALVALIVLNWDKIKAKTTELWETVKRVTTEAWDKLKSSVSEGIAKIVEWFRGLPGKITGALGNMRSLLVNAGKNVIDGLIRGITSKIGAVRDAMSNVTSKIRNFLPFSPAKEGPLSGSGSPLIAGAKIGEMLAGGLVSSVGGIGRAASAATAAARIGGTAVAARPRGLSPAAPVSPSASRSTSFNVTQQFYGSDPSMLKDAEVSLKKLAYLGAY